MRGSGQNGEKSGDFHNEAVLLKPLSYLTSVPGKNFRRKFAMALNHWLQVPAETLNQVCEIVDLLHNSSLLIDDIEDGSVLRRGVPAAHLIYGVGQTINCANYAYFIALDRARSLNHPKAVDVFLHQILELHRGQGMELHWRDMFQCPTEEQYKEAVIRKSGGIFLMCLDLLRLFSKDQRELSKLISLISIFFQIRDDYQNLMSEEYAEKKSYCEDLTEGKFSFPVVHSLRSGHPQSETVSMILREKTRDIELKRHCVSVMEEIGSFSYARKVLAKLYAEIRQEIASLGGNPALETLLVHLASTVIPSATTNGQ